MFYKLLLVLCGASKVGSAASDLERQTHDSPFVDTSKKPAHYQSIVASESVAITPLNDMTPAGHPVLRKSWVARKYVETSTLCCFLGRGWFQTGAFVASVATCAIAGIAYGVSDPYIKDQLNLTLVILTADSAALKKFENYARAAINDQENEYKMFDLAPTVTKEKNELPKGPTIV